MVRARAELPKGMPALALMYPLCTVASLHLVSIFLLEVNTSVYPKIINVRFIIYGLSKTKIVLVHSALEVGPRLFSAQVIVILVLPQTLHVAHHELLALS